MAEREVEIWGGRLPDRDTGAKLARQDANARRGRSDPSLPPEPCFERASKGCRAVLADGSELGVETRKNPAPKGSFGYASTAVQFALPEDYRASAMLLLPLDKKLAGAVDRESVRVFRWDATVAHWSRVGRSGVHQDHDVAWAWTTRPGV